MMLLPRSLSLIFMLLAIVLIAATSYSQQSTTVCLECHSTQTGQGGKAVIDWRASIHAANGISCHHCHGGDPADTANAMSPARGFIGVPQEREIPSFCGRCHVGVEKDFLASAHGRKLGKGGPTCVTCHGNHDILPASIDIISETLCSRCHSFDRAAQIREAMKTTEGHISRLEQGTSTLQREGMGTESLTKGLFAARNRYRTLFHEVNVNKVRIESTEIESELSKFDARFRQLTEERQRRRVTGAFAVAGAVIAAILLYLLRKTYR